MAEDTTPKPAALLGVEHSLKGARWTASPRDERQAEALRQRFSLSDVVSSLMVSRGISLEDADRFLNPSLRSSMPNPSVLKDMDRTVERLKLAIDKGEQIAVLGDYDVDGATSVALLVEYFKYFGKSLFVHIPNRLTEGYGPSAAALTALKRRGATLCILVDCGTLSYDALDAAHDVKLDCLVLDHHQAAAQLPKSHALVNPNRLDDQSDLDHLAACGVTFMVLAALNRHLRETGAFQGDRKEPNLLALLDLVALGTVCDVVPVKGLNRAFVAQGLKLMGKRARAGLNALSDVAGVDGVPTAFHAGYLIGPRLNAAGRLGEADLAYQLLVSDDRGFIAKTSTKLDQLNADRRAIEQTILDEAMALAEDQMKADPILLVVGKEGWHAGVTGIVASRLKERFQRPAFVIAFEQGVGKGSGRSVRGIDLGALVLSAQQEGQIAKGGGHSMAAGITLAADQQSGFFSYVNERADQNGGRAHLVPSLIIDATLSAAGATGDLVQDFRKLAPFGVGNREPRFAIANTKIVNIGLAAEKHVRATVTDHGGQGRLNAILFGGKGTAVGDRLLAARPDDRFHLVGHLRIDQYQSRNRANPVAQLVIEDASIA